MFKRIVHSLLRQSSSLHDASKQDGMLTQDSEAFLKNDVSDANMSEGDKKKYIVSDLNLYPGYDYSDLNILRQFSVHRAVINKEFIIDGFGRKSKITSLPNVVIAENLQLGALDWPVPDDGYMSETAEYVATAIAVDRASESFRMAELGAGWGPWTTLGAAMCRRKGIKSAYFLACEAMPSRRSLLEENLKANNLMIIEEAVEIDRGYSVDIQSKAVSDKIGIIQFPDSLHDMGAAIAVGQGADYRGLQLDYVDVPCTTFEELLGHNVYDFIHMDIQGAEFLALEHCSEYLKKQVRSIFVGTHTRKIEGDLIEFMYAQGFSLRLEKPCRIDLNPGISSVMARTTHDGAQYWINEKI